MLLVCAKPAVAWKGVVTRVLDGDSFQVRYDRSTKDIRLYGIDCPEYRQTGWTQAKKATQNLVRNRWVDIHPMDVDRYGRTVALVRVEGRLLNADLVRNGWAWVSPRYCHAQPLCRQLTAWQKQARQERRGIWREKQPVPPWVWKQRTD
jgi:endonuclease YncB( thermonuclease family)